MYTMIKYQLPTKKRALPGAKSRLRGPRLQVRGPRNARVGHFTREYASPTRGMAGRRQGRRGRRGIAYFRVEVGYAYTLRAANQMCDNSHNAHLVLILVCVHKLLESRLKCGSRFCAAGGNVGRSATNVNCQVNEAGQHEDQIHQRRLCTYMPGPL